MMTDRRFQRRISDIRDRMNAQFNRILNEEDPEEGSSLVQRFEMFRREEGVGPLRRRRRERSTRIRQITFKVSVLRSPSLTHYRSHRDATPASRVVVNLNLDAQEFFEAIRQAVPHTPEHFQLCRVSGTREVVPLEETCPRTIHESRVLGRSSLYLLPKISGASDQQPQLMNSSQVEERQPEEGPRQPQVAISSQVEERQPEEGPRQPQVAISSQVEERQSEEGHRQPQVVMDEFYIDSEGSDSEEILPASPPRISPDNDKELSDILKDFQSENLDPATTTSIIARRRHILKSACVGISRSYFTWHKTPQIEFVGEMADDYGGPRREFFRLLMLEVQSSMGVFEGKQGDLLFTYDQQSLDQNKYFMAGKFMAWSIMHNGPGPRCINQQLFKMMCGERPDLSAFDVEVFMDPDLRTNMEKLQTCRTPEVLTNLKVQLGDWIAGCGVPAIFTATLQDLPHIRQQIVAHFLYHRVASMIQQFTNGLDSCGQFWQMVKRFWKQFLPVFTNTGEELTRNCIQNLFTIIWSAAGSNRRDLEEDTIFQWEWWLMAIQEGEVDISFRDLLVFVSGADCIPPLGFQQSCSVEFYDQDPGTRRIPYSSTCSLSLFLPRGISDEEEFKDLMLTAIKGSLGFGKV